MPNDRNPERENNNNSNCCHPSPSRLLTALHIARMLSGQGWFTISWTIFDRKQIYLIGPGPPLPPTTIAPRPTKPTIPYEFKIQHFGGKKCFKFQSADNRIHLTSSCDDIYYFTSTKLLKHAATGKCVKPTSHHDNALLYLNQRCDDDSKFQMTSFGSLKHIKTGKCAHPLHGRMRPIEGRKVVIYSGCDILRLKFTLGMFIIFVFCSCQSNNTPFQSA